MVCTMNRLCFKGFSIFHLYFEIFYLLLNMLRCCDCTFYVPKKFYMHDQNLVLLACYTHYLSKFLLDNFHNSGVDIIIYVGNIVITHEPSDCALTSVFHLVFHKFVVRIKFETNIFKGRSVQLIPTQCELYMNFKNLTYRNFFTCLIIIFGI